MAVRDGWGDGRGYFWDPYLISTLRMQSAMKELTRELKTFMTGLFPERQARIWPRKRLAVFSFTLAPQALLTASLAVLKIEAASQSLGSPLSFFFSALLKRFSTVPFMAEVRSRGRSARRGISAYSRVRMVMLRDKHWSSLLHSSTRILSSSSVS